MNKIRLDNITNPAGFAAVCKEKTVCAVSSVTINTLGGGGKFPRRTTPAKYAFATLLLCLAAVFAGCECGTNKNNSGTVTISGTAETGATLTAISTPTGDFVFTGVFTWQWADSKTAAESVWNTNTIDRGISGENSDTLTLDASLEGKYIRAKRNDIASKDEHILGPVTPSSGPRITISGIPEMNQKLTATSSGGDFTGDFTWERTQSMQTEWHGVAVDDIAGTNGSEFTLDTYHTGYIRVKRSLASGEVIESDPFGPIVYIDIWTGPATTVGQGFNGVTPNGGFTDDFDFIWEFADSETATAWQPVTSVEGEIRATDHDSSNDSDYSRLVSGSTLFNKYVRVKRTATSGKVFVSKALKVTAAGRITISGTPVVGEKLTATSTGLGFEDTFLWFIDEPNSSNIDTGLSGDNNCELLLTDDLVGKRIIALRSGILGFSEVITAGGNTAPIIKPKPSPSPIIKQPVLDSSDRTYADAGMSSGL
ncbi:MAG: hypothetical protein LBH00_04445 [Planctomycetaceae bacterium]|jgi:hypothetical protein|nr:hypothetical protein [Planctomycetaceae bacterium]